MPSAPQSIKAIPASSTKIIVSWLPPKLKNGELVSMLMSVNILNSLALIDNLHFFCLFLSLPHSLIL